jgi:hypothetical protein
MSSIAFSIGRTMSVFSLSQTARFDAWVKVGKTISFRLVGPQLKVLPITHGCNNLAKIG